MKKQQTLILVRGLPGAGKSTKAIQLATELGYTHVESDMYFMEGDDYKFDRADLLAAHEWCRQVVATRLADGESVVVSNTFTQMWEMAPYIEMVNDDDEIGLIVLKVLGNFKTIHNVPGHIIGRMKDRWQDYPEEITIYNISFD